MGNDEVSEGRLIADKYRVEGVLGRGGMGVVYRATHRWTGRQVAVKVLLPEYAREEAIVQRFMNEARAAALLRSEHVVDVLDMGLEGDGTMYLALELLDGESLAGRLASSGTLAPEACAAALLPAMDALATAHEAGIVHRDIKPDNLFLHRVGGREVPKLLDFGVAKFREQSQRRTTTGTVLGTVLYMSPEQAQGLPEVGPASDVWAMGVVWYECLAGAPPFVENSVPATLLAITQGRRAPLAERRPDAPRALVDAVERALQVDLAARWPDMRAFAGAVRRAVGASATPGLDATLPALGAVEPAPRIAPAAPVGVPTNEPWVRRKDAAAGRSRVGWVAVVAALVGGGAAAAAFLLGGGGRPSVGDVPPRAAMMAPAAHGADASVAAADVAVAAASAAVAPPRVGETRATTDAPERRERRGTRRVRRRPPRGGADGLAHEY